jgi:hypothetical protein
MENPAKPDPYRHRGIPGDLVQLPQRAVQYFAHQLKALRSASCRAASTPSLTRARTLERIALCFK